MLSWLQTIIRHPYTRIAAIFAAGVLLSCLGRFSWLEPHVTLSKPLKGLLSDVGIAIAGTGVFTAVVKTLQLSGVFTDDLREVLRELQHPKTYAACADAWNQTTHRLLGTLGIPEYEQVAGALARCTGFDQPTPPQYWYRNCVFKFAFKEFDVDTGMYSVEETLSIEITARTTSEIVLAYKWYELAHGGQSMKVQELKVNGHDCRDTVNEVNSGTERRCCYELPMSGEESYTIYRRTLRTSSFFVEPYLRFNLSKITLHLEVELAEVPAGLLPRVSLLGTPAAFDRIAGAEYGNQVLRGAVPLFPSQGFEITLSSNAGSNIAVGPAANESTRTRQPRRAG